jgi:hypothetical protein
MIAKDKGRQPRFRCQRRVEIVYFADGVERRSRTVELINCSLRGIGFLSPQPISAGDLLMANLLHKGEPRTLIYLVRHCQPAVGNAGAYDIGAEYTGYIASPNEAKLERVLAEILGSEAA